MSVTLRLIRREFWNSKRYRACYQPSHNAIMDWNSKNYSAKIIILFHRLRILGNSEIMHCDILLNMPYVDWLSSVQLTLMSSSLLASSRLSLSLFSRSSNVSAIVGGSLLVPPACTTDSGLLLSVEAAGGSIESTRAASACSFRSVVLKLIYILISHSARAKNKWRWWRPH